MLLIEDYVASTTVDAVFARIRLSSFSSLRTPKSLTNKRVFSNRRTPLHLDESYNFKLPEPVGAVPADKETALRAGADY